jgi:MFS family permease
VLQLIVTGLAATALHATKPTVTYRALSLGASPVEVGLILSSYSILPALTAVAIGRWIDRVGESRYLMLSLLALSAGSVMALFAPGLLVLGLAQIAMGFGQIIYLVASQSLVANQGPREGREARFGHYSTVTSIGQLAGPAIGAAIVGASVGLVLAAGPALVAGIGALIAPPPAGLVAGGSAILPAYREAGVFLFGAVVTLVASGLAFLIPSPPRPARDARVEHTAGRQPGVLAMTRQVLRRPGMIAAIYVSVTVISAVDVLIGYLPAYGEDVGLSIALVGTLLSVRAGASLISRLFMSQLIARIGRSRLLGLSMLVAGGGLCAVPFLTSAAALIAVMVIVGLGLGLGQPMTIAWVANSSHRSERATALGVRITGNRVALLVVPTAMGAIAGSAGISAIFVVMAAAMAVGAGVALRTPFDDDSARPQAPLEPPTAEVVA